MLAYLPALALLAVIGCVREAPKKVLSGSVFIRDADGRSLKIPLARVYPLLEEDLIEMALAGKKVRERWQPLLDSAEGKATHLAKEADGEEAELEKRIDEKKKLIADLKKSGSAPGVINSFEYELAKMTEEMMEQKLQNLQAIYKVLDEKAKLGARSAQEIESAQTMPLRPIAAMAISDEEGKFRAVIPDGCEAVLVEAEAGKRMAWIVRINSIEDFSRPYLFSEHNMFRAAAVR